MRAHAALILMVWLLLPVSGAVLRGEGAPPGKPDAKPGETAAGADALSPEARELLAAFKPTRAVRVEAFVSPEVPEPCVAVRAALLATLRGIQAAAGDKVRVFIHETEWLSDEAARAEELYGIKPRAMTTSTRTGSRTDNIYLSVAVRSPAGLVRLPLLAPGMSPEYELVRTIFASAGPRKRIGVVRTDANLFGDAKSGSLRWPLVDELEAQYEVVGVNAGSPIKERYDVLLAVQPSTLPPEAMDHLVEAVRAGQPTAIFEDPCPRLAPEIAATSQPRTPPGGANPMMMTAPKPLPKGEVRRLWNLLGIECSADVVVWQDYNPYPRIDLFREEKAFVFVGKGSGAAGPFDQENPITRGLQNALFPYPGAIAHLGSSPLQFTALAQTGKRTGTARYSDLVTASPFGPPRMNPNPKLRVTKETYVLAAEVRGKPKPDQPEVHAVVVADVDMLSPTLFALRDRGETAELGIKFDFDNVPFVLSAVDVLSGDTRFLELRRRAAIRPPDTRTAAEIERDEKLADARARIQKEYDEAVARERDALDKQLRELQGRKDLSDAEKAAQIGILAQEGQRRGEAAIERIEKRRDEDLRRLERRPAGPGVVQVREPADAPGTRVGLEEFDPAAVARLEFLSGDETSSKPLPFEVALTGAGWVLASHDDYPVGDRGRVRAVADALARLTIAAVAEEAAKDFGRYGVVEPDSPSYAADTARGTRVTLRSKDGRLLFALIVGREAPDKPGTRYVRRPYEEAVYTAALPGDLLSTRLADWHEKNPLQIDAGDVQRVEIDDYSVDLAKSSLDQRGQMTIERRTGGKPGWALAKDMVQTREGLKPAGAEDSGEINAAAIDAMLAALAHLKLADVAPKPPDLAAGLKAGKLPLDNREAITSLAERGFFPARLADRVQLVSAEGELRLAVGEGVEILLRFGTAAQQGRFLLVTAEFREAAIPKPEKAEDREAAVDRGKTRAAALNERFAGWYYVVPDEVYRKIRLGRGDIVKKTAPTPKPVE